MLRGAERPVTGLEISSSQIAAVKVKGSGRQIEVAGIRPLRDGIVRDGEVVDPQSLAEAIHELFAAQRKLTHTVRVGITNQSTVMRVVELPPAIDRRDIGEAIRLQMPETIPLPADDVVFSHQVLGPVDTPTGIRTRVVVVAARKRMIDDFLAAVHGAGLKPVGVDLSAFALIRALYRPHDAGSAVAYLGVGGLSHVSVAVDGSCLFSRVLGAGEDQMASQLLGRLGLARERAHQVLVEVGAGELGLSDEEVIGDTDSELTRTVRETILSGVRRIADESRTSLDYFADQPGGLTATKVVIGGSGVSIPGLPERLSELLRIPVENRINDVGNASPVAGIDPAQLQVAVGLTIAELHQ